MYLEGQRHKDILKSFFDGLPHSTVSLSSRTNFRLECITKLVPLTEPNIRSLNPQVIKGTEKILLQKTLDLMQAFGLNYVQAKNEFGDYEYVLKP